MSNRKRNNALFGAVGILAGVLIIAGFAVFLAQGKGLLTIQVMDAPVELKNLYLTIDWVRIQGENGWENLTLKTDPNPFNFDLLTLQNVSETLSITEIPAGNYSMIEMHVLAASATYPDDSTQTLNVPRDVITVLLKPHMELEPGGKVTVLIDLQPEDLNTIAISHSLNLRPVVKAVVS